MIVVVKTMQTAPLLSDMIVDARRRVAELDRLAAKFPDLSYTDQVWVFRECRRVRRQAETIERLTAVRKN